MGTIFNGDLTEINLSFQHQDSTSRPSNRRSFFPLAKARFFVSVVTSLSLVKLQSEFITESLTCPVCLEIRGVSVQVIHPVAILTGERLKLHSSQLSYSVVKHI